MGYISSTMPLDEAPSMYPMACLDQLRAAAESREVLVWPTVLVRESSDGPGTPRRLTVSARTSPMEASPCR